MGIGVNQEGLYLNEDWLEITFTVPLKQLEVLAFKQNEVKNEVSTNSKN